MVTPENGYTSARSKRVDMRLESAFTVDGELVEAESGRVVSITAHDRLRFIRA